MKMTRCLSIIACSWLTSLAFAQVEHRVNLNDGSVIVDPVNALDSITFDIDAPAQMRLHRTDMTVLPITLLEVDTVAFGPMTTWTFEDPRDGNVYAAVMLGDQCWMAENLRFLPSVVGAGTGSNTGFWYYVHGYIGLDAAVAMATPAYSTYGVLYNWSAAMQGAPSSTNNPSGVQGICPDGWHLPSDDEVKQLEIFLGLSLTQANNTGYRGTNQGSRLAGDVSLWNADALTANPFFGSLGFDGLPGSLRSIGSFGNTLGEQFAWWTATGQTATTAWYRNLQYSQTGILRNHIEREFGMSVRCVCNQ